AFLKTAGEKFSGAMGLFREKIEPFFLLGEGRLNLGKITLQVLLAPGHSPGSVCFYWPDRKILFTGDVVFYGSVGRTDLPGGSLSRLQESIEKLAELDVECLLPGHFTEYGAMIRGQETVRRNFQAIKMFFI
ncbi:MAG: MBL fold metallo-hydrolase, partial [Bacillota bacterium]